MSSNVFDAAAIARLNAGAAAANARFDAAAVFDGIGNHPTLFQPTDALASHFDDPRKVIPGLEDGLAALAALTPTERAELSAELRREMIAVGDLKPRRGNAADRLREVAAHLDPAPAEPAATSARTSS